MLLKNKLFQLTLAFVIGAVVWVLPRPEGKQFRITGNDALSFCQHIDKEFNILAANNTMPYTCVIEVKHLGTQQSIGAYLTDKAKELKMLEVKIDYVDGLSPKAMRFLAVLAVLLFLFILEPIPLEITAISIGVLLVMMGIGEVKDIWASYMHPVVVFIMCCLVFAIAMDKAGLTKRLGYFIIKKAGNSVVRFTFIISIGLGIASSFMHDAAATAVGIVTMLPLIRAVGIDPNTNTARFMMISLAFACSCGGMGSLIGGGRCMVSAAFLKEFTGIEISFFDWIKYAMPAAIVTVPAAVGIVFLVFPPDRSFRLPEFTDDLGPWSIVEKKTLIITGIVFVMWLTKGLHGLDYSIPGMLGVGALVISGVLKWNDIHENLEWGTALFIFGGGIALGLAMGSSGAANYFAHLFFPMVKGGGWLLLFAGVAVFGALVTNAMANVAAAALILPIVIPMAQLEGVNPIVLALCLGMATSFAMLLIIGCPPNAIAYSFRYFKASDLAKVGIVAMPVLLCILILVVAAWWRILGLI